MVKERIRALHKELPPSQKALAEFILDHIEEVPFWSIHTLAKEASTSTASVVRISQRLGYTGFPAMRDDVVDLLKMDLNRDHVSRIEALDGDVLSTVASQDVKDINDTLNQLDRHDFDIAVKDILQAQRVYTAGLGISNLMAEILAYQLNQVGIHADSMRTGYTFFLEQLAFLERGDVLIGFSYPPYSKDTVQLAQGAREKGLRVIAITNKPATPISFHADVTLPVKSENILFTNAFAAMSVIINALATECAHQAPEKAQAMLAHFQTINGNSND